MHTRHRAAAVTLAALALLLVGASLPAAGVLVINDTSFVTESGLNVTINGSVEANTADFDTENSIFLRPRLDVRGSGTAFTEVNSTSGAFISLTNVDADTDRVRAVGGAGQFVIVRSDTENVTFRRTIPSGANTPFRAGDGIVDFVYKEFDGDTSADIELFPVSANRQYCAVDADTDTDLDCATSSGQNRVRFDDLTTSSHDVVLQLGKAPNLNDTSASPQPPNEFVSDRTTDLEIDVDDREFPSDTVTIEFFVDGNSVGTDTRTTEGTASVSSVSIPPGQSEWHAVATDDDGLTDRSANFTVTSPGIITVRNNSDNTIITSETVTAEFFTNSGIETKTTNNGEIDMINLPNQDMRVDFTANNFSNRSFQFFGVDSNETVFMAPESATTSTITFTLNDETGNFPPTNTTLIVEESRSGTWTRVVSELFKSQNEVEVDLDPTVTYRLRVRNNENDTRVLGTYNPPDTDETKTLTIEETVGTPPGDRGFVWDAQYIVNESGGNDTIQFTFNDPANETTDLEVHIYERDNRINNTIFADNFTGPLGSLTVDQDVPPDQENVTWVVNATGDRDGEITRLWYLQKGQSDIGLDLDPELKAIAGVILLLLIGFMFGGVSATMGGIVIPLAGMLLWYIDWLPPEVGLPAILAALFLGVANSVRTRETEVV